MLQAAPGVGQRRGQRGQPPGTTGKCSTIALLLAVQAGDLYTVRPSCALDELLQKQRAQLGNRVAPSTKEGILSVISEVRRGGVVAFPRTPSRAVPESGVFVPFCIQALTSKFVPGAAGGKAVGLFLNAVRLPDNSGFR